MSMESLKTERLGRLGWVGLWMGLDGSPAPAPAPPYQKSIRDARLIVVGDKGRHPFHAPIFHHASIQLNHKVHSSLHLSLLFWNININCQSENTVSHTFTSSFERRNSEYLQTEYFDYLLSNRLKSIGIKWNDWIPCSHPMCTTKQPTHHQMKCQDSILIGLCLSPLPLF